MKVCTQPGCPTLTNGGYCSTHARDRDHRRGNRQARGYDNNHVRVRSQWEPKVQAGGVTCWRCGEYIQPGTEWDLGHDDHDRSITRGPEHARTCNRSAAGKASHLGR